MTRTKKLRRLEKALLEMAEAQHRLGIMNDADYREITIRHLGQNDSEASKPISAKVRKPIRRKGLEVVL